jgi:hypothetical protein
MKRWFRTPSPALVVSAIALFAAFGGTAYASGLISGSQIKNHSISAKKLTTSAVKSFHGRRGPTGPRGLQGAAGAPGQKGDTGQQGPGATAFVYDQTGASAAAATTLGTAGPYTLSAECVEPTSGTTDTLLRESGPSTTLDGFDMITSGPHAVSIPSYPAHPTPAVIVSAESTSVTAVSDFYDLLFLPSSGSRVDMRITLSATGGTTNTCHASVLWYPSS